MPKTLCNYYHKLHICISPNKVNWVVKLRLNVTVNTILAVFRYCLRSFVMFNRPELNNKFMPSHQLLSVSSTRGTKKPINFTDEQF